MRPALLSALLLLAAAAVPLRAQSTPAGRWQAVSDVTGKTTSIIEIRQVGDEFVGTVRDLFSASDSAAVCDRCSGERRGQRILGMPLLTGMHADGGEWNGGSILDPESGHVYRATMHLEDAGRRLIVRGYIGFVRFGRSQVWRRAE